jgi:ribonuclease BN (tRNA processing enzyme)
MRVIFLGVGSAFDPDVPNNCHLVITEKTNLLLDCGWTGVMQLSKYTSDVDLLDAIYITHWHADHYFGLPALLLMMWEGGKGRTKPLMIISRKGFKEQFEKLMDLAYLGFKEKFKFEIKIIEIEEGVDIEFQDLKLSFLHTVHSGENLAIKIEGEGRALAYTGDGAMQERGGFYKSLDLLIAETYLYDEEKVGHSSIVSAMKLSEENNIKCLALTHLNRRFRKDELPAMREKIKSDKLEIIIPEPLEEYNL